MERLILGVTLPDRARNEKMPKRFRVNDFIEYIAKLKWRSTGHLARL